MRWYAGVALLWFALPGCKREATPANTSTELSSSQLLAALPQLDLTSADQMVGGLIEEACERVRNEPESAEHWGQLSMLLLAHDFVESADVALDVAGQLAAKDARWPYLRGMIRIVNEPDVAAAREFFEQATERAPQDVFALLQLADVLVTGGQLAEAESRFERVLLGPQPLDPMAEARAHAGLGEIALQRNDLRLASLHLEKSVRANAQVGATRTLLAQVYFQLGELSKAREQLAIAEALPTQFRWPDPYYEKVMSLQRGMKARLDYASALAAQGKVRESIEFCEQTVALYPDDIAPQLILGQQLLRVAEYGRAKDVFEEASREFPDAFDARFMLGVAYEGWGKPEEAVSHYAQAASMQPNLAYAFARWGECLFKIEDLAGANEAFAEAVRLAPNDVQSHKRLGQVALLQQRNSDALTHFEHAQQLAPDDQQLPQLIAEARSRQQKE